MSHAVLVLRYRTRGAGTARVRMEGHGAAVVDLPPANDLAVRHLPLGSLAAGEQRLTLVWEGGARLELDGFVLVDAEDAGRIRFVETRPSYRPEIGFAPNGSALTLKYEDVPCTYGLAWEPGRSEVREFLTPELDAFMRHNVHHHTRRVLGDNDSHGHYTDVFLRPIALTPHGERSLYALLCAGERAAVEECLAAFDPSPVLGDAEWEAARARRTQFAASGPGAAYAFGLERLAATVETNVVYPTYCRRHYIRHGCPGRWWDSLYTWDSGFIGLGLAEVDLDRAVDTLNTYVTPPGDPHAAFLHHGSPVPVQFYLFQELWNRTQDTALLAHFYPRLQQYHRFLAGRLGSSTTR